LQVALNLIDFNMNISEAITAGRVHHQWLPDILRIEKFATTADSWRLLETMGHRVDLVRGQGSVMGIVIEGGSAYYGASDPRQSDAAAVGY